MVEVLLEHHVRRGTRRERDGRFRRRRRAARGRRLEALTVAGFPPARGRRRPALQRLQEAHVRGRACASQRGSDRIGKGTTSTVRAVIASCELRQLQIELELLPMTRKAA